MTTVVTNVVWVLVKITRAAGVGEICVVFLHGRYGAGDCSEIELEHFDVPLLDTDFVGESLLRRIITVVQPPLCGMP